MDERKNFENDTLAMKNDIGFMVKLLHDTLEKRTNEHLRAYGLTFAQARTLQFLYMSENGKTTQKELEDFFNVSHPTINGILKRLEEKGRITTEIAVNRRLTKIVRLTDAGRAECEDAKSTRLGHEAALNKYISDDEKKMLLELLGKVYKGIVEEE